MNESLRRQSAEQQANLKEYEAKAKSYEIERTSKNEDLKQLKQQLKLKNEKFEFNKQKSEQSLNEMRDNMEKLNEKCERLKGQNVLLAQKNSTLLKTNEDLNTVIKSGEKQVIELKAKVGMLEKQNSYLNESHKFSEFQYKNDLNILEQIRCEHLGKVEQQQLQIDTLLNEIDKLKVECQSLFKLQEFFKMKYDHYKTKFYDLKLTIKNGIYEDQLSGQKPDGDSAQ